MFKTIGIVGAGQMGRGIAQVTAAAGIEVVLADKDAKALARALDTVREGLSHQAAKGRLQPAEVETDISHIRMTQKLADLK